MLLEANLDSERVGWDFKGDRDDVSCHAVDLLDRAGLGEQVELGDLNKPELAVSLHYRLVDLHAVSIMRDSCGPGKTLQMGG